MAEQAPTVRGCFRADHTWCPRRRPSTRRPFPKTSSPVWFEALASAWHSADFSCTRREAISDAARRGRHVVIATPTASGKSLCFHLPVLDANRPGTRRPRRSTSIRPRRCRATRSSAWHRTCSRGGGTPHRRGGLRRRHSGRCAARREAALSGRDDEPGHAPRGDPPCNTRAGPASSQNLRYVVIDEMHTYRGVFGSATSPTCSSRLRRVARFHGADPTVRLRDRDHRQTPRSTRPASWGCRRRMSSRHRSVDRAAGEPPRARLQPAGGERRARDAGQLRQDAPSSSPRIWSEARVPTILFGQSRNNVEIMLKYLRDRFREPPRAYGEAIFAYRGGYLPDERRAGRAGASRGARSSASWRRARSSSASTSATSKPSSAPAIPGSLAGIVAALRPRGAPRGAEPRRARHVVDAARPIPRSPIPDLLLRWRRSSMRASIPDNAEIAIQHLKCASYRAALSAPDERYGRLTRGRH